jgi:hypothetical protein
MLGAQNFYYFDVLEYVVMIEIFAATTQMKSFYYDAIKLDKG